MKQLLIPFKKNKTSLGQLYYDKEPAEVEPSDLPILKELAPFLSKEKDKIALQSVFFDKTNSKIVVSNAIVLLEIQNKKFKSDGVFPPKGKSVKGITYPYYKSIIPTLERSPNYTITTKKWVEFLKQALPLIDDSDNEFKSKKGYLHFGSKRLASYDLRNLTLILQKALDWGNDTVEVNFNFNSNDDKQILLFYFNTPFGYCQALLMNMFDRGNVDKYPEILEKNILAFNHKKGSYLRGILSITKDDFYTPLEASDIVDLAANAQAQRIRILKLKYKYAIQQNKGIVEVTCIELNASNNIVRHKRELTMLSKGLAYIKDPDYDAWEVYFVLDKLGVNIQRVYNDIDKLKKYLDENPDYDFKTNLYSEGGFVGKHLIEFAKTVGWPYKELEAQREAFLAERKRKETEEYNIKQQQQKEAKNQELADRLERVTAIQQSLKDGKQVNYYELIELIKNSDMKVSPRTMGAIYKQNDRGYIGTATGSFVKKTSRSTIDSMFEIVDQASTATIKVK